MSTSNPHRGRRRTSWTLPVVAALVACLFAWSASARARHCRRDADCDGLTNQQERALGTNPSNADSDHDGLSDSREVSMGSDAVDADSDADGVDDGDEVATGTNPEDGDTDDDGVGDAEDHDPRGVLEPKLAGPVDSVDAAAKTVSLFGCLVVDASSAELDGVTLEGLAAGAFVEIKLDGSKLPALVAKKIEAEDEDHDGTPDND